MTTTLTSVRARPLHEDPRIHGRRWFLLATMCLSLVLVVMSVSGLVTAIPRMQEELNASASQIQWILTDSEACGTEPARRRSDRLSKLPVKGAEK